MTSLLYLEDENDINPNRASKFEGIKSMKKAINQCSVNRESAIKNSDIHMDCQHFFDFNSFTNTPISSTTLSRPLFTFCIAALLRFDFLRNHRKQNTLKINIKLDEKLMKNVMFLEHSENSN